jgi:hypothetical protein
MNGLGETELELEGEFESELEGEFETEFEGEFESEFESEFETEAESEFESEFELEGPNPVNKVYPDAMMEHLGLAAMEAESEFEAAEHFLPLIPLVASKLLPLAAKALPKIAGKILPRVARVLSRATPKMTRAVSHLTRSLHRNPRTRQLVRAIPSVARRAVHTIAKRAAAGHPVTPRQAVKILAHANRRVLGSPQILRSVLQRSRKMDHRFHPHRRYYHGWGGTAPGRGVYSGGTYPYAKGTYPYARGRGGYAAHVCPTCGRPGTRGVRRVCCCC